MRFDYVGEPQHGRLATGRSRCWIRRSGGGEWGVPATAGKSHGEWGDDGTWPQIPARLETRGPLQYVHGREAEVPLRVPFRPTGYFDRLEQTSLLPEVLAKSSVLTCTSH